MSSAQLSQTNSRYPMSDGDSDLSDGDDTLFAEDQYDGLAPEDQLVSLVDRLINRLLRTKSEVDRTRGFSLLRRLVDTAGTGYRHEKTSFVLRNMLPLFLMTGPARRVPQVSAPSKMMTTNRDLSLRWITDLIRDYPELLQALLIEEDAQEVEETENSGVNSSNGSGIEKAEPVIFRHFPVLSLLQRIVVFCVDRAEWRRSCVDSISSLLTLCSCQQISDCSCGGCMIVAEFSSFVTALLSSRRASYRQTAVDVLVALLEGGGRGGLKMGGGGEMLNALAEKCRDTVPTVRATALKALGIALGGDGAQRPAWIPHLLAQALKHERPLVRRAALQGLLDPLLPHWPKNLIDLALLKKLAMDGSLSVRKAAVSSLGLLHELHPRDMEISSLWVDAVLPLVVDPEGGVVEKILGEINGRIIEGVVVWGRRGGQQGNSSFSESSVGSLLVAIGRSQESGEFLQRGVRKIVQTRESAKRLADSIDRLIEGALLRGDETSEIPDNNDSALIKTLWLLLEEIAALFPQAVSGRAAEVGWEKAKKNMEFCTETAKFALRVLVLARGGSKVDLKILCAELSDALFNGRVPPNLIYSVSKALSVLGDPAGDDKVVNRRKSGPVGGLGGDFARKFIKKSTEMLQNFVTDPPLSISEETIVRFLTTVGECAVTFGLSISDSGLVMALQAIATNTIYKGDVHFAIPSRIRGAAYVALGKLCLKQENLAKKGVNLFVLALEEKEDPIVRNNVLLILGDLCITYTGLVDRFLPVMTGYLKDPVPMLRMQALMTLSSLIAEDFIKFKGGIVFRFLYALSDGEPRIKNFVEAVFSRLVLQKQPALIKNHFADAVCALNGFARQKGVKASKEFSLSMDHQRREKVYRFMLNSLATADLMRIEVINQLVKEILTPFADEVLPLPSLDSDAGKVFTDTLTLLSCKELNKLAANSRTEGDGEEDAVDEANKKLVSGVHKSVLREKVIPILIQLKRLAEDKLSELTRDITKTLVVLLSDFQDELESVLHGDKELVRDVIFDLNAPEKPKISSFTLYAP